MIHLGVIGLGTIFQIQIEALVQLSEEYQLTAVYDRDPGKRKLFCSDFQGKAANSVNVYASLDDFLADDDISDVLIATPPATHFDLAEACLRHGKNVLLEKPAILDYSKLEELYQTALSCRRILHIAYHSSFARDELWFVREQKRLQEELGLGKLKKIECGFYDPYMADGAIIPRKRPLGGSFIDSGVNELSVCARLVDLKNFHPAETTARKDPEGMIYNSSYQYTDGDCTMILKTGWDYGKNEKTTRLWFENFPGSILLDHSNQQVVLENGPDRRVLFADRSQIRLIAHYLGVFSDYSQILQDQQPNRDISLEIHRLLLDSSAS